MKKDKLPFFGAATALITPMNGDGSIDFDSLGRLIDFQIESGIDALLVLGTTGEPSTLTEEEKRKILSFTRDRINGRVPLIVGTGTNDTKKTADFSRYAALNGADAVLVVTPYYNKTTDEGLILHYKTVAESCDCPVILYNVPTRTGMNISLQVYKELSGVENIVGVKEASGNIGKVSEIISECGDNLTVWSGNDSETVPVMALGGAGVFSVLSNIMPREVVELTDLMKSGRYTEAAENAKRLNGITKALFFEVNPIPVKEACRMIELTKTAVCRPPLCEIVDKNRLALENELKKINLI